MESDTENMVQDPVNKENIVSEFDVHDKEVTEIMTIIADTGKYWHQWDLLKSLLSHRLKQVMAEYPESQKDAATESQDSSLSGETCSELEKRLNEALLNFTEGPPFTLQRLCEILLDPKSTYNKLSKLALALERNLLVTSTLHMCTDPYPGSITRSLPDPNSLHEENRGHISHVQNGVSGSEGDAEEEMVDAMTGDDNMNEDVEMQDSEKGEMAENCTVPTSPSTQTTISDEDHKPSSVPMASASL